MAIASGISGQLGVKAESVYGTPVTVDRFYEFVSESIKNDIVQLESRGIGRGRFLRSDRIRTPYIRGAAGAVELEVLNKDFGLLFQHMLGENTVTGASANKTHTCQPDAAALLGKSLTLQVGRPDIAGTVQPFTYEGVKVTSWELKCAVDEILHLVLDLDAENCLTGTALASAVYTATTEPFVFTQGAVTVGGAATKVKNFSLKGDNGLATDRRFLGNSKLEPLAAAEMVVDGQLECEFGDLTAYAAWLAGTQAALVLTFTSGTIIPTTAVPFSLTITIPKIVYTGETPNVGGPGILQQARPFKALYDGTNPICKLEYITSDTAA
jgi:hypothetical protein